MPLQDGWNIQNRYSSLQKFHQKKPNKRHTESTTSSTTKTIKTGHTNTTKNRRKKKPGAIEEYATMCHVWSTGI